MKIFDRDDPERGGDIVDRAAANTEMHLTASLARQRGASDPETHPDFNGANCVGCECEIPAARLALGKVRCVSCQSRLEDERKQRNE